jgi:arsenate reductase (thioredoxin)
MAERGIDISDDMGCGDACPIFPGTRYEDWDVADPAGRTLADVRPIRDEIRRRVEQLVEDLRGRQGSAGPGRLRRAG